MPNVTVNLALVGAETFSAADRQEVNDAVHIMRTIFLGVGLHIEIERFVLPLARAGSLVVIRNLADAQALTKKAIGPANGIDMFVVKTMLNGFGWSPVGGPCDKTKKGMTGAVVSLNGTPAERGNTFAHELGHFLGLNHCPCSDPACSDNFIRGGEGCNSGANTGITAAQGSVVNSHCAVRT